MSTVTLKRWILICLFPLLAVLARAEKVGLLVTAVGLTNSSGVALPDNSLIQVIANTAGQTSGGPTTTSFVSGADVVLASFGLNSSTTGIPGSFQIYLTIDRSAFPGLNPGAPLVLRWYDIQYSSGQTAPGSANYGQFTTNVIIDDSTSGWTLGVDGSHSTLKFISSANGGSQSSTAMKAASPVGLKALTITATSGQNKVYGENDPTLTYSITSGALTSGDVLTGAPTRAAGSSVGQYTITQGTLTAGANYNITFVSSDFTITAKPVSVTANAGQAKEYGDADPAPFGYQITSGALVGSDTLTGALQRSAGENAGTYAITQGTLSASSNYALTYVGTNFTINKAALNVSAENRTRAVGEANPTFNALITGFKGSDTLATAVTGAPSLTTSATSSSAAGSYPIIPATGSLSATNYTFVFAAGTLTVSSSSNPNPVGSGLSQTITFAAVDDRLTTSDPITLNATASSGLPVTFALISGPAVLSGNTLTLTGQEGQVVIRASQAGNATYNPASSVDVAFTVTSERGYVYFGTATNSEGSVKVGDVAATLPADRKHGTLLIVAPVVDINTVMNFTLNDDGTFSGTIPASSANAPATAQDKLFRTAADVVPLTLRGSLIGDQLLCVIDPIGLKISTQVLPQTGPSSGVAGLYTSNTPTGESGTTYVVVGTNNEVLILTKTSAVTTGGLATLGTGGTFNLQTQTTLGTSTISGTIDRVTTTVAGNITIPGEPVTSFTSQLTTANGTSWLINLSSRGHAGTGDRTLITGFVIGGNAPKQVLIRGIGPALTNFGIQGALPNPSLRLFHNGDVIAENDDWSTGANASAVAAASTRIGAFPLGASSKDAALLMTLPPGAYTIHVLDASTTASNATGVALAEVYDASTTTTGPSQRLLNISTRGEAGTGENILIAGFIIEGSSPKKVLIRGIGPGLASFGVGNTLSDPRLRVFQSSTLIAENNNWSDTADADKAALATAMQATGAFILPAGSRDAELVVTLAPGAYTALVGSADGKSSGVALIEIFEF